MYLQSNDGGEWSDNCILQYTQFAPKQQYSAKEKELSILPTHLNSTRLSPKLPNYNHFDK